MKTLLQYKMGPLQLVQPSIWKREHQLKAGEDVIMTMRYPKWYSNSAVIEGFGETWELRRPSIWRSVLEIKKPENQLPFAKYVPEGWKGSGMFELPNGGRIEYRFNLWKNLNELYSHQKILLASFKRPSIWKMGLTVTFHHESELIEKNPWIVMVVYGILMERRQHAGGTA